MPTTTGTITTQLTDRVRTIIQNTPSRVLVSEASPLYTQMGANVSPTPPAANPQDGIQVYGISTWAVEGFGPNSSGDTANEDNYSGPVAF